MKNKFRLALLFVASTILISSCDSSKVTDTKKKEATPAPAIEKKQTTEVKTTKTSQIAENKVASTNPLGTAQPKGTTALKTKESPKETESNATKSTAPKFIEGKHYVRISPEMQTDAAPGKVEVLELMWLGCGHCYALEPTIVKYEKNHPDFVDFKQVPATLNPSWTADAKTYLLASILDPTGEKELVTQIFQAIHDQRRRLRNPDAVLRLFKQFGFTEQQVKDVQNSMAFQARLKRAQEISESSKADSVPTIIINGKYRTSVYMTGSEEKLLEAIKYLTEKEKH